ncbi:MAG: hypothetical protein EAZ15_07955 [Sphingobacteriales bacterium]|nr:MAG: hypothetical protein EAZ15_07955 [Sphingobacteriales bacterium]
MMRYFFTKLLYCLIIANVLSSCGTEKNILFVSKDVVNTANLPVFEIQKGSDSLLNKPQVIKPGDELILKNLQNDALISGVNSISGLSNSSTPLVNGYIVESDSLVILPVIGSVKLGGLTRLAAEKQINALYQKSMLKNPLITLSINNLQVTLLGEFSHQGVYPLKKEQTHLAEMIGQAGGLNLSANNKRLKIIRGNPQNPKILMVDLTNIDFMKDKRVILQNNDIVYAEPKKSAQNADKMTKTQVLVGMGLTLINTLFLIYNFTK